MDFLDDKEFRRFCLIMLFFYLSSGYFGAVWISDEFDTIRMLFFAFVAVPCFALFLGFTLFYQEWWKRWVKSFWALLCVIVLCASWGNFLLVNALGDNQETLVSQTLDDRAVSVAYYRGGFGWLYRRRF